MRFETVRELVVCEMFLFLVTNLRLLDTFVFHKE